MSILNPPYGQEGKYLTETIINAAEDPEALLEALDLRCSQCDTRLYGRAALEWGDSVVPEERARGRIGTIDVYCNSCGHWVDHPYDWRAQLVAGEVRKN